MASRPASHPATRRARGAISRHCTISPAARRPPTATQWQAGKGGHPLAPLVAPLRRLFAAGWHGKAPTSGVTPWGRRKIAARSVCDLAPRDCQGGEPRGGHGVRRATLQPRLRGLVSLWRSVWPAEASGIVAASSPVARFRGAGKFHLPDPPQGGAVDALSGDALGFEEGDGVNAPAVVNRRRAVRGDSWRLPTS